MTYALPYTIANSSGSPALTPAANLDANYTYLLELLQVPAAGSGLTTGSLGAAGVQDFMWGESPLGSHFAFGSPGNWSNMAGTVHPTPWMDCQWIDGANKLFLRGWVVGESGNPGSTGYRSANGSPTARLPLVAGNKVGNIWAQPYDSTGEFETPASGPGRICEIEFICTEDPTPTARGGGMVFDVCANGHNSLYNAAWLDNTAQFTLYGPDNVSGAYQPYTTAVLGGVLNIYTPIDATKSVMRWRAFTNPSEGFDFLINTSGRYEIQAVVGAVRTKALEVDRVTLQTIFAGTARFNAGNTTGAGSAALGANCPAVTAAAPYTWLTVTTADGSTAYIPAWK